MYASYTHQIVFCNALSTLNTNAYYYIIISYRLCRVKRVQNIILLVRFVNFVYDEEASADGLPRNNTTKAIVNST